MVERHCLTDNRILHPFILPSKTYDTDDALGDCSITMLWSMSGSARQDGAGMSGLPHSLKWMS